MATTTNPAPAATTKTSVKLTSAIGAYQKAVVGAEIALDTLRNTAKAESVRLSLTDGKMLTLLLFACGLSDPRTVSEVSQFVFPKHEAARVQLDRVMEHNCKQTDPKKRIAKPVTMALQRDKTGTLTLEAALAAHKAGNTLSRQPGGQTNQTVSAKPVKKKTQKEIEDDAVTQIIAILKSLAQDEYDEADCMAVFDRAIKESKLFPDTEAEEPEEEEDASE